MILNFRYIVHFLLLEKIKKEYGGQLSKKQFSPFNDSCYWFKYQNQMNYLIGNTK
ncbi:hypothetical protein SAMN05421542_1336 [Chryseobacterium jejuense]|uniref:Uncharacterized protein n=1 Tax=Chryseobacterium jejuense TaxID=445960 RepID=A0A2X2X2J3_CHRJE|nr:hypothetical protein SAMN05421542_1336 [Chryseobacterium jejuense]SQB47068.1 Uncharacterised protein [Chryseobacterium jejuense]